MYRRRLKLLLNVKLKQTLQSRFELYIPKRYRWEFFTMKKSIYKILFVIAIIIFLIIVVPLVLFTSSPNVDSKMSVDNETPVKEQQVAGLLIEFENGTTEPEVKDILENCNMTRNWIIEYNADNMGNMYYVKVDEDKRNKLRNEENWNEPVSPEIPGPRFPEIKKGNYYYIIVSKEGFEDESFLNIMEKYNLQVKKSVRCYILFGDGSMDWNESKNWIPRKDAIRIKSELEMNERVLIVSPDYIEG